MGGRLRPHGDQPRRWCHPYDLDDDLRFDPTITVDSATIDAAPEGVETAGDWDGAAQTRIATDVPLLGVDDEGYAPHVYTVRVVANVPLSFDESDIEGAGPACTVPAGDNQLEQGLNNVATVTTDADEDHRRHGLRRPAGHLCGQDHHRWSGACR